MNIEKSFSSLNTNDIKAFEQKHNLRLPDEYTQFLLKHNGGRVIPASVRYTHPTLGSSSSSLDWILGIHEGSPRDIIEVRNNLRTSIPRNLLPIATDIGGSVILMSVSGTDVGKIYYWDYESSLAFEAGEEPNYENLYLIADSFSEFLISLTSD